MNPYILAILRWLAHALRAKSRQDITTTQGREFLNYIKEKIIDFFVYITVFSNMNNFSLNNL